MKNKTKTLLAALAVGIMFGATARAGSITYGKSLVNGVVASTSPAFVVDFDSNTIHSSSWQSNLSTASPATITFDDGKRSTASLTVSETSSLGIVAATETITVAATSSLQATFSTATLTIVDATTLLQQNIVVNGRTLVFGVDIATATTSTGTAVNIATYFIGHPTLGITCSSNTSQITGVVAATATVSGPKGNAYTLSSSTGSLTISGSTAPWTGGAFGSLNNAVMTVQGTNYSVGIQWKSTNLSSSTAISSFTATSIATLLNKLSGIRASTSTSNPSVVTATATTAGVSGNSISISFSNAGGISQSSTNFTGGSDSATVALNGTSLIYGTDFTPTATSSGVFIASVTAKSISNAILNSFSGIIGSTFSTAGVVSASSTFSGVNAYLVSSNKSYLVWGSTNFTGGLLTDVDLNADTINAPGQGLSTAYSLLFSTVAGATAPTGLSNQSTYYAIIVDSNTIKLAATSTGAISGVAINISSQTQIGGDTFTLTPTAVSGAFSFKWQVSNDNVNWIDMSVSSATLSSTDTAKVSYWDFGTTNNHYLRALIGNVMSFGGVVLQIIGNGNAAP